jgi:hypothetical protein
VGLYEDLINRIIQRHGFAFTADDFYCWCYSFGINFKNYIRFKQLMRLFSSGFTRHYQTTMALVMKHYLNSHCTTHCLTSRKINADGRRLHLDGMRLLRHSFHQLALPRKP